jgi:hypothetical protein
MGRFRLAALALALGAIAAPARAGNAPTYSYQNIDVPGAVVSQATGINSSGTIIGMWGTSNDSIHATAPLHGFVREKGVYATIDRPGTDWTYPQDLTDSGTIVGYSGPFDQAGFALGPIHGFRLDGDGFTDLSRPNYGVTFVTDTNDQGRAIGFAVDGVGAANAFSVYRGEFTSIQYPGAQSTYSAAINEPGSIWVGALGMSHELRKGVYAPVTYPGIVPGVWGANNAGDLVGEYRDAGNVPHGFAIVRGGLVEISVPGSDQTVPLAINERGDIVGEYLTGGTGLWHAFLATAH